MRKQVMVTLACAVGLLLLGATTVHMRQLPEGVEVQGGVVKLKPGYAFQRASNHKVYSYAVSGPNKDRISGTFDCYCDRGSGSCSVFIEHDRATCKPLEGCKHCQIEVTVGKDGKLQVLRPGGSSGD